MVIVRDFDSCPGTAPAFMVASIFIVFEHMVLLVGEAQLSSREMVLIGFPVLSSVITKLLRVELVSDESSIYIVNKVPVMMTGTPEHVPVMLIFPVHVGERFDRFTDSEEGLSVVVHDGYGRSVVGRVV